MTEDTAPGLGALYAALAKAQGQMTVADKDRTVGFDTREDSRGGSQRVKYSYATLAGVWESCRKPLSDNGLAVVQLIQTVTDKSITVNSILGHASGQSISSILTLPVIGGTAQAVGSAITYARRYALMALVGIVTDEDDDGQAASKSAQKTAPKPVNPVDAAPEIRYPNSPEAQAKIDAKTPPPANTWIADAASRKYFWGQAKSLGYDTDGAHKLLGVERMGQFKGTLEEALDILRKEFEKPGETRDLAPFSGEDIEREPQP